MSKKKINVQKGAFAIRMKIIDERGKLFGLINVIDLAVLLAVILVVAAFFVVKSKPESAETNIKMNLVAPGIRPEVVKNIKTNENLVAGNEVLDTKVTEVKVKPAAMVTFKNDGTPVLSEDPLLKDIYLTVEGSVEPNPAVILLSNQEVRIGKKFALRTPNYELETTVTSLTTSDNR